MQGIADTLKTGLVGKFNEMIVKKLQEFIDEGADENEETDDDDGDELTVMNAHIKGTTRMLFKVKGAVAGTASQLEELSTAPWASIPEAIFNKITNNSSIDVQILKDKLLHMGL